MKGSIFAVYCILMAGEALLSSCHRTDKNSAMSAPSIDVAYPITDSVTLTKSYPGTLKATQEVSLVARVSGTLTSVQYNPGEKVKKGQLLFTIDETSYRDAVQQAEANLATAESSYEYAMRNYEALKKALESDAVSKIEVIQAESTMHQGEADIKSAKAALDHARTQLGYCRVYAPFDGRITSNTYDAGSYINGETGAVELATIYNDDKLNAKFYIEDSQFIDMMKQSEKSTGKALFKQMPIKFEQQMPHNYTADLSYISPNINQGTGTIELNGTIDNPYGELKSGMYVTVDFPYDAINNAILVKDASIGTDQRGQYLYTVNDSNQIVYSPIETGQLIQDSLRLVSKGITGKTPYVTKALLKVRPGETIKPNLTK